MSSENLYVCSYSSPNPYTIYLDSYIEWSLSSEYLSNNNVYCFPVIESFFNGGDVVGIYSIFDSYGSDNNISQIWTLYLSNSPITYSSSNSGGSDSSSWILSGWTTVFSWIISSLWSVMSEFIPYVAFVGLWLLGAIIGFVAIKRLVNRIRAKILWTFSGWRRRK